MPDGDSNPALGSRTASCFLGYDDNALCILAALLIHTIFDDTVFPCREGVSMRKAEVSFDADIPWAGKELNTLPGGLDSSTSRSVSIFWRSSFTCRHLQTGSSSESFVSSSATILERMAALCSALQSIASNKSQAIENAEGWFELFRGEHVFCWNSIVSTAEAAGGLRRVARNQLVI